MDMLCLMVAASVSIIVISIIPPKMELDLHGRMLVKVKLCETASTLGYRVTLQFIQYFNILTEQTAFLPIFYHDSQYSYITGIELINAIIRVIGLAIQLNIDPKVIDSFVKSIGPLLG